MSYRELEHVTKDEMRRVLLEKRKQLTEKEVLKYSKKVSQKIANHDMFKRATVIMGYIPYKNEVDIKEVFEIAWLHHKTIVIPKTNMKERSMELYSIESWEELELGNYNIWEPIVTGKQPYPIDEVDLVLVPGVAFDYDCYRIGYGGGYYDRFFDRFHTIPYRVGIAYDFQLLNKVPFSSHDYPVDSVITETNEIIRKNSGL